MTPIIVPYIIPIKSGFKKFRLWLRCAGRLAPPLVGARMISAPGDASAHWGNTRAIVGLWVVQGIYWDYGLYREYIGIMGCIGNILGLWVV